MTLPRGFSVRLNHRVRVKDDGRVLVGGAPTRVVYLSEVARRLLVGGILRVTDDTTERLADRLLENGMADPVLAALPAAADASVTVVVPARDRPAALDRLLGSLGSGIEVIVVDDQSLRRDDIAHVVGRHGARLVRLPINVGPAGARNAGLRLVSSEYVAFIDSDMVVDPNTIPMLARHFADPAVALVAPRIAGLVEHGRAGWVSQYEEARSSLDLGRYPSIVRPRAPVSWLPAACLLARVEALDGGFSDDMRVAEDVDLVWRLAGRGWRVRYEPAVQAQHEHRVRIGDWLARKTFYGTGAHSLALRHGHNVAPAVLSAWSVAAVLALLAQRRWSLPVAGAISAITAVRIASKLGRSSHPMRLGLWLTGSGLVSALAQTGELLLRHWWPMTVVGCLFSKRLRRAVLAAAIADAVVEHRRTDSALDPVRFGVARRLDDLAYGTGVWLGAVRGRSAKALLPDVRSLR